MYKLGLLLLVTGVLGQHQVTQQIQPAAERQIRLEDIERDSLKSSAAQQTPTYQQPSAYHNQQQQYQQVQPQQQAVYQQQVALPTQQQAHHAALYPQFQIAPAATAYHTPQIAYHPQQIYQSAAAPAYQQQFLQPLYLQPQAHHSYNVPLMIIPYPLQQDLLLPKIRGPIAPAPAQVAQFQPQQIIAQTKFRPSPQVQYPNPYSGQIYQQKFAAGVKSTPAPTVKDNYVQQQPGFNYKLQ